MKWLRDVTSDSVNQVAIKSQVSQTHLNKQVKGQAAMTPEVVVKVSRAYQYNPLDGLYELGLFTPDELAEWFGLSLGSAALSDATEEQLLAEIRARLVAFGAIKE